MKLEIIHQLFTKLKQTLKTAKDADQIAEEYRKMKKEVRPLKTTNKFRPEKGNNRDISAI